MTAPHLAGRLNRRSFLGFLAVGAGVVGVPSLLTGCTTASGGPAVEPGTVTAANLPTYVPLEYVKPDFPSVNGSTAGYATIPEELVTAFDAPPGSGGTYTAMTPLWSAIPKTAGNPYFDSVNAAMGTTVEFQISDGNTYGDKLAAVLASAKDVPDWVCVPTWNFPPRFAQAVDALFEDLTPYLSGDNVKKYKNLANIPTDAWRYGVFNDRLYGLPFPGELVHLATFYRADILEELGITEQPRNADEFIELAKELTDPGTKRWGSADQWITANMMFAVLPEKGWKLADDGSLVSRVESEEYRAALDWQARLYKSGAVHPTAVADKPEEMKPLFEAGEILVVNDGVGGWHESLGRVLPSNPTFDPRPFDPIAHDGGTPRVWKGAPADMFSFLKKTDDKAQIEELLAAADFLASPFGTTEFQLVNFGLEGEHYEIDGDGLPQATDAAADEVAPSYIFLVDPPKVNAQVQYPGYVEAYCTWMAAASEYVEEPLFYGMQISEPAQFASLATPFEDLEKDIARGRKSMADLDDAVATWSSSGGEELRAFYQDILDEQ
jgi:putative aldouronate transport system substrate-binding protein